MIRKRLWMVIIALTLVLAICLGLAVHMTAGGQGGGGTMQSHPTGSTGPTATTPPTTQPEGTMPPETTLPEQTQPETEPEELFQRYTLSFVGDCTLGCMPDRMNRSNSYLGVVKDNYTLPFQYVYDYFSDDDCTFANLEGVFIDGEAIPADKQFTFRGPTAYANILTMGSVEMVTLANNHTHDFGDAGYLSTKAALDAVGMHYVEKNSTAIYTTESGLVIGIYGVYWTLNETDMRKDVEKLREKGAEIIVASMHVGTEGSYQVNDKQRDMAHKLIDGGVDIVWGHHPHVLQPIEEYNGGIIYYSLGNFSFGGNHDPYDYDTAILRQEILRDEEGNVSLGVHYAIPCSLSSKTTKNDFQPMPYASESPEFERVLSKLDGTYTGEDVDMSYRDQYDKPTEPTNPSEPTEPTEPAPTEPEESQPSEPTEPTEPTEPVETQPEVTEPEVTEPAETQPEVTDPPVTDPPPAETEPEG